MDLDLFDSVDLDSDLAPPPLLPKPGKDNARLQKLKKKRSKKKPGLCQTPVPFRSCLSPVNEVQTDLELDLDPRSPSPPKPGQRLDQKPDQRSDQRLDQRPDQRLDQRLPHTQEIQTILQKPNLQIPDPRLISDQDFRPNYGFTNNSGPGPVQVWTGPGRGSVKSDFSPEQNLNSGYSFMRNQVLNQSLLQSPYGLVQTYPGSEPRFCTDFGYRTHFSPGVGQVWARSEQKVAPLFECSGFMFDEELTQNQVYHQSQVYTQNQVYHQNQVYPPNQVYPSTATVPVPTLVQTPVQTRIPGFQTGPPGVAAAYGLYSNLSAIPSYPPLNQTKPSSDPIPRPRRNPTTLQEPGLDQTTTFSIQIQSRDPALERPREVNRLSALNPGLPMVPEVQSQTGPRPDPTTMSQIFPEPRPGLSLVPNHLDQSRIQPGFSPSQTSFRPGPDPVLSGPDLNGLSFSQPNKVQDPVQVQTESRTFTSSATFSVSMQDLTSINNKTNRNPDLHKTKNGLNQDLRHGPSLGKSKAEIQAQDPRTGPDLGINGVHEEPGDILETSKAKLVSRNSMKTSNKPGSKPDVTVPKSPGLQYEIGPNPETLVQSLDLKKNVPVLHKPAVVYSSPVQLQEFGLQPMLRQSKNQSKNESKSGSVLAKPELGLVSLKTPPNAENVSLISPNATDTEKLKVSKMYLKTPAGVTHSQNHQSPRSSRKSKNPYVQVLIELGHDPVQMNLDQKETSGSNGPAAEEEALINRQNRFSKSPTINRKVLDPDKTEAKIRPESEGSLPKLPTLLTVSPESALGPGLSPGLSQVPEPKVPEQVQTLTTTSVLSLMPLKTGLDPRPQTFSPVTVRTLSCFSPGPGLGPDQVSEARKSLSSILESQMKTQTSSRPRSYYGLTPSQYQAFGGIKTRTLEDPHEDPLRPRTEPEPSLESGLGLKEDRSETESEPRIRSLDLRDSTGERPGLDRTKNSDQVYPGPDPDWTTDQDWTTDRAGFGSEPGLCVELEPQTKLCPGLDRTKTPNKVYPTADQDWTGLRSEPGLCFELESRTKPQIQGRTKDSAGLDWSQTVVSDGPGLNLIKTRSKPRPGPQVRDYVGLDWAEIRISEGLETTVLGPDQTRTISGPEIKPRLGPVSDIYNIHKLDSRPKPDLDQTVSPSPVYTDLDFSKSRPNLVLESAQEMDQVPQVYNPPIGLKTIWEPGSELEPGLEPGLKPDSSSQTSGTQLKSRPDPLQSLVPKPSPRLRKNRTKQRLDSQYPGLVQVQQKVQSRPGPELVQVPSDPQSESDFQFTHDFQSSAASDLRLNSGFLSLEPGLDLDQHPQTRPGLDSGFYSSQSQSEPIQQTDFVGFENVKLDESRSELALDQDTDLDFLRPTESGHWTEGGLWSGSKSLYGLRSGFSPTLELKESLSERLENPPKTGLRTGLDSGPGLKPEVKERPQTNKTSSDLGLELGPKPRLEPGLETPQNELTEAARTKESHSFIDSKTLQTLVFESGFSTDPGLRLDLVDCNTGPSGTGLDVDPGPQLDLETQLYLPENEKEVGETSSETKTSETGPGPGLGLGLDYGLDLGPDSRLGTNELIQDDSAEFEILETTSPNTQLVKGDLELWTELEPEPGLRASETGSELEPEGLWTRETGLKTGLGLGSVIDSGSLPQEPDTEKSRSSQPKTGLDPPQSSKKMPLKTSMKTSTDGPTLVPAKPHQDQTKSWTKTSKEATLKTRLRLKETLKETMDKLDRILDKKGLKKKTRSLDSTENWTWTRTRFGTQESLRQENMDRDKSHSGTSPIQKNKMTVKKEHQKEDTKTDSELDLGLDLDPTMTENLDLTQTRSVEKSGFQPEAGLDCTTDFQNHTVVPEMVLRELEPPQSQDFMNWTRTGPGLEETLWDLDQNSVDLTNHMATGTTGVQERSWETLTTVHDMDLKTVEIQTRFHTQTQSWTGTWTGLEPDGSQMDLSLVDSTVKDRDVLKSLDIHKTEDKMTEQQSVEVQTHSKIQTEIQAAIPTGLGPNQTLNQDFLNITQSTVVSRKSMEDQTTKNLEASLQTQTTEQDIVQTQLSTQTKLAPEQDSQDIVVTNVVPPESMDNQNMDDLEDPLQTKTIVPTQIQTRTKTETGPGPDRHLQDLVKDLQNNTLVVSPKSMVNQTMMDLEDPLQIQTTIQSQIQAVVETKTQTGPEPDGILQDLNVDLKNNTQVNVVSLESMGNWDIKDLDKTIWTQTKVKTKTSTSTLQDLDPEVLNMKATNVLSLTSMEDLEHTQTKIQTETWTLQFSKRSVTSPVSSAEALTEDSEQKASALGGERDSAQTQTKTGPEPVPDQEQTKDQGQAEEKSLKRRGKKTEKLMHLLEKAKAECENLETKIRTKSTKKIQELDQFSSAKDWVRSRGGPKSVNQVIENLDQKSPARKTKAPEDSTSPQQDQSFDSNPAAVPLESEILESSSRTGQDPESRPGSEPEFRPEPFKDAKSTPSPDQNEDQDRFEVCGSGGAIFDQKTSQSGPNQILDKSQRPPEDKVESKSLDKDPESTSGLCRGQDQSTSLCEEPNIILDSDENKETRQPSASQTKDEPESPPQVQDTDPESRLGPDKDLSQNAQSTLQSKSGSDRNKKSLLELFKKSKSEDQDESPGPSKSRSDLDKDQGSSPDPEEKKSAKASLKSKSKGIKSKVSGWTRLKKHMVVEQEEPQFPRPDPESDARPSSESCPELIIEPELVPDLNLAQIKVESEPKALKMWDALLFHMFSTKERIMKQLEINQSQKAEDQAKTQTKSQKDSVQEPSFVSRLPLLLYSPRFDARKLKEAAEKPMGKLSSAFEKALIRRKTPEDPKKDFNRRPKGFSL